MLIKHCIKSLNDQRKRSLSPNHMIEIEIVPRRQAKAIYGQGHAIYGQGHIFPPRLDQSDLKRES